MNYSRNARLAAGLCGGCGGPMDRPTGTSCAACCEVMATKQRVRAEERRARGLCPRCAGPHRRKAGVCRACRAAVNALKREAYARGHVAGVPL